MPPRKPIFDWIKKRGIQGRNKKGQFIPRESTAFLIQRSIFNTGIKKTEWFTKAFELKFKRLEPKIEDAMTISIEKLLDFTVKENFKK